MDELELSDSLFSITVLVAEAVNFRLGCDGSSWVTFQHVPDNHVLGVVITSCSHSNSNKELIVAVV